MAAAGGALAALVGGVVGPELGPHLVDLVEKDLLVVSSDGPLQRTPESSVACVRVVLVVEGEQPGIADHAVVEPCGLLVPQFAGERTFEGTVVDEVLLVGGKCVSCEGVGEGGGVGYEVGLSPRVVVALPELVAVALLHCDLVEHGEIPDDAVHY